MGRFDRVLPLNCDAVFQMRRAAAALIILQSDRKIAAFAVNLAYHRISVGVSIKMAALTKR
jgi:hypothetical protein